MKPEVDIPYGFEAEYSNASGDKLRNAAKRAREAAKRAAKKAREAAERAAKNAAKKAAEAAKKGTKAAKDAAAKAAKAAKKAAKVAKKARKPFARFNPRNAASRAAALVALRKNAFGVSSRLAPAFINDSKFKPGAKAAAQPKWEKVKKHWGAIGGKTNKLEEAIRLGYKKSPIKNLAGKVGFKKHSSIEGDEEFEVPEEAQDSVEGMTIIGSIIKIIKGLFQPFVAGAEPAGLDAEILDGEEFSTDEDIPDVNADGEPFDSETGDVIESEEIKGIPKAAFWGGAGFLTIVGVIVTVALVKRHKGKTAATAASK